MIVGTAPYEVTDPTIDSQVVKLQSSGADLLYDITTPKFATQAIRKVAEIGWKPQHILTINSTSIGGYGTAELLVDVLAKSSDELTRDNVMYQAAHLTNVVGDLSLPGMSISTTPTDYRVNKQLQMMRFNGTRWELFGPIITDEPRS